MVTRADVLRVFRHLEGVVAVRDQLSYSMAK
jgi:hypothetical protein